LVQTAHRRRSVSTLPRFSVNLEPGEGVSR
jgi:hypothetical protein